MATLTLSSARRCRVRRRSSGGGSIGRGLRARDCPGATAAGVSLERLEQSYRRLAESKYRYESAGGRFVADQEVNAAGFVTVYPGFCQEEATGR